MATKTRTRTTASTLEVCKNGRKWDLVENGTVIDSFKTKTAALNELEACKADVAPKRATKSDTKSADVDRAEQLAGQAYNLLEQYGSDFAALDRTIVLKIAKAEAAADKAWKASGMVGDRPARPALDWLANPFTKPAKAKREPVVRTTDAEVEEFLREFMGNGNIPKASDIYAAVRAAGHKVGGARMTSLVAKIRKEVVTD